MRGWLPGRRRPTDEEGVLLRGKQGLRIRGIRVEGFSLTRQEQTGWNGRQRRHSLCRFHRQYSHHFRVAAFKVPLRRQFTRQLPGHGRVPKEIQ